jgi:hypothetical protein
MLRTDIGIAQGDYLANVGIRRELLEIVPGLRAATYRS